VDHTDDFERDFRLLEAELRKLESEYNMYFSGQLPIPPWETRRRVQQMFRRYDRAHIPAYADRYRLSSLQHRFALFVDLWDRGLRAREEGRPGPFGQKAPPGEAPSEDRILHVTVVADPAQDFDKLQDLYNRLADTRRETGQQPIPFHRFVDFIRSRVRELQKGGHAEVAFRLSVSDGKVALTARSLKGAG
jgi:hypothetical protein